MWLSADGTIICPIMTPCPQPPRSYDLPPSTKRVCLIAHTPSPPALPSFQALLSSIGCAIVYAMRTAPSVSVIAMAKEFGYSGTEKGQVSHQTHVPMFVLEFAVLPNAPAAVSGNSATCLSCKACTVFFRHVGGGGWAWLIKAAGQPGWEVGAPLHPLCVCCPLNSAYVPAYFHPLQFLSSYYYGYILTQVRNTSCPLPFQGWSPPYLCSSSR